MARKPVRHEMSAAQYRGEGSEADWRVTVKEMATRYGWNVLFELPDKAYAELGKAARTKNPHTGKWEFTKRGMIPVMTAIRGQPDLLLGHSVYERVIVVELKIPGESPTDEQMDRLELYSRSGVEAYVWETGDPEADLVLGDPHTWHPGWIRP